MIAGILLSVLPSWPLTLTKTELKWYQSVCAASDSADGGSARSQRATPVAASPSRAKDKAGGVSSAPAAVSADSFVLVRSAFPAELRPQLAARYPLRGSPTPAPSAT